MSVRFISEEIYSQLSEPCGYIGGTFKAAWYNFTVSTDFDRIKGSKTADKIAKSTFSEPKIEPSFDLKARHFFSHILVGIALLIPILNFFIFIGLTQASEDKIQAQLPPKQPPRKATRVRRMTAAIQNKKEQKPAAPLDGKRSNPVSIQTFKALEKKVTENFYRLFPNETCDPSLIALRKKTGSMDYFTPLQKDLQYIQALFLKVPGYTPEKRFSQAEPNLDVLFNFLDQRFPTLNKEFYLCANYKNDIQNLIDEIPYVNIIKSFFFYEPEQFLEELNHYTYTLLPEIKGERIPIQVSASHQLQKEIHIPGLVEQRLQSIRL